METFQRFCAIMSVALLLLAALAVWRIVTADGREIWYIPVGLVCASGLMACAARKQRSKKE